jgi:hypothetical protein
MFLAIYHANWQKIKPKEQEVIRDRGIIGCPIYYVQLISRLLHVAAGSFEPRT